MRAAETAAVLAGLGFRNVRIYDSSWLASGLLNARLAGMQARIDMLERELERVGTGGR